MFNDKEKITAYSAQLNWFPKSSKDFEHILRADKHTTIEGNAAEIYTEEILIRPVLGSDISSFGWWFGAKPGSAYSATAVSSTLQAPAGLRDVERKIASEIGKVVDGLSFALFTGETFVKCTPDGQGAFARGHGTAMVARPMMTVAAPDERNPSRLESAIGWLRMRKKIGACGVQRLYANFFAAERYIWDVDCIGLYRGHVVAFDVKHKFPSRRNGTEELGANGGISRLYDTLSSKGILVVYIVLKKPEKGSDIPAVELLEKGMPEWLACKATAFGESATQLENRQGTGYRGDTPGDSKGVRVGDFQPIGNPEDLRHFLDRCLGLQET